MSGVRLKNVLIRDATPGDAPTLARIHLDARADAMPWLAKVHSDVETDAWMACEVVPRKRVRVATVGGAVAGFSAFADGWLNQLYVRPDRQRLGVGRLLLDDVRAVGSFRFWVFQRNVAARRFYERHGARLLALTDGRDNEEREPDALYDMSPAALSPP